MNDITDIDEY